MAYRNELSQPRTNVHERRLPETKSFVLTSEFWVAAVAAGAMLFAGYVLDDIANPTAWRFTAFIAMAYVVSRGIAKAGSSREYELEPRRAMWRSGRGEGAWDERAEQEWSEHRSHAVGRDVASDAPTRTGDPMPGRGMPAT